MSYATVTFLCFIAITGLVYFIVPKKIQWTVLLAASMFFYIISCGARVLLLLGATMVIYCGALSMSKLDEGFALKKKTLEKPERKALKKKLEKHKKLIVTFSVLLILLMLFTTKYFNFFGGIINTAGGFMGLSLNIPALKILMPLGISYYTLMGISYTADVYRGTCKAEKNPLMLLLFLCYFPHIVEGPFDRFNSLSEQFRTPHYFDYDRIKFGILRFIWGVFKKAVIADRAGLIVNTLFESPETNSGSVMLFAVILYTIQIYAEFSGCMDMVIGVSKIFDINISENFKRPFFSASIAEFWRRWHITLGLWLKDYVFYPVSLSSHFRAISGFIRKHIKSDWLNGLLPSAYALFFVWFINGLWHGASGKFIFYGLYYYLLMMIGQAARPLSDRVLKSLGISRDAKWYHTFEVLRTCIIVCFGMLIFRATSLGEAADIFIGIFTNFGFGEILNGALIFSGIHLYDYIILALAIILVFVDSLLREKGFDLRNAISNQILPLRWSIYMVMIFSVIIFGAYGGSFENTAFIYGEF